MRWVIACVCYLLLFTSDALTEMSVSVVGPVYADDSEEAAPSPLQVAAMFTVTPQHSSPLTIPAPQSISSERHAFMEK